MLSVSLGLWQDRPASDALLTAKAADDLGYPELWIGEMATYDAFALATAVGLATERISLTLGPFAVAVRDPMMIAMGAASVADLVGRRVDVAIGTSSPLVVEQWHGRPHAGSARALAEHAEVLRGLLDGEKSAHPRSSGYRLRLDAPRSTVSVAAFGPQAVKIAARADRMVLNLITPASAARLIGDFRAAGGKRVTAWVTAATGRDAAATEQLRRGVVGYLAAPGYGEMFTEAGFGDVVAFARTRPHPRELLAEIPNELLESVGLLGPSAEKRLAEYRDAGVDEIAVVPASTADDPGGAVTLRELRALDAR
ncbi:LLM class F420-dependent oxidoreductase [Herbidospora galbida]|uniref:LLM class F420-dependent oxidoreductase n=1 Tax=Herbidospora galbida TaxID=2575442 RepID=A0A4U3MEX1_9ACTN|nr:LLM class F420-dependent oxidoreductase [Herbidospora galbida]TKK86417.1 LLM class F420-dependent oxidoreductase [Herbidospora galbida]